MGIAIGGVDRKREKGSFSGTEVWHFITCRESTIRPMKERTLKEKYPKFISAVLTTTVLPRSLILDKLDFKRMLWGNS